MLDLGLSWDKLLVIVVVALLLIGPEKLPRYAEMLGSFVRRARDYLRGAQERVKEEMGPDFDEEDWKKLDPRQYDPRRIVREALFEDAKPDPVPHAAAREAGGSAAARAASAQRTKPVSDGGPRPVASVLPRVFTTEEPPPYDDEAT